MTIADLRTFLAIARALGITRAAKTLGVPKAAVSKSLARLERQLGAQLFHRSTRRIAITRAGALLQRRAEAIVADTESLVAELRRDERELRGRLCIAGPPELGVWLTERLFAAYLKERPHVRLTLKLDYGLHDLFDPDIDLTFRIGSVRDENLVARPLGTFVRVLVASPELERHAKDSNLDALKQLPCIAFDEQAHTSTWTLSNGATAKTIEVNGAFAARSYPAILAAARAGLGIAFLPDFVVEAAVKRKELVRVLRSWSSPAQTLHLMHRVGHARVERVAAMLRLISAHPEWLPVR